MQRHTEEGVIIACDFTGIDWDEHLPMIEGHRGSVLSLTALARAIGEAAPVSADADPAPACTMCLKPIEAGEKAWRHPAPPSEANLQAIICWDCIQQADRAFDSDPDTDWIRQIPPDKRWR